MDQFGLGDTTAALLAFGDGVRYDPAVPTPTAGLGFKLGQRLCRHADFQRYFQQLAAVCDHASYQPIGASVEGRELFQLVISSPANLARLDAIRADLAALADPNEEPPPLEELPVVVWIIANVHGGEHSSAESTLALAYHLLASREPAVRDLLDQTVVVIDPLQNPDGRDRSVNNYYALGGIQPNPDRHSVEHGCPWPGARGSHYAFDLNRDWCLLTHPETRARVASFLAWRPQVVADLHEMTERTSYYFPPPAPPIEVNVPPSTLAWWEVFGRANAAAFDRRGWDYFVGETFDSYYPGYGEAWPLYHGAVGMTYEQASPRSLAVRRDDGTMLTLADALAAHFVAAMTTIATAAAHRDELLTSYRDFHRTGTLLPADNPHRAILIDAAERPGDAAELADLLRAQGVAVETTAGPFTATVTAHDLTGGPTRRTFAAGSLVVDLCQPASRLARVLLAAWSPLPAWFVQEERERVKWRAEREIYDVTSWSAPYQWGLDAFWSLDLPELPVAASLPTASPAAAVAYACPAGQRATQRLMAAAVGGHDVRCRVSSRDMVNAGRRLPRGSVFFRRRDHSPEQFAALPALAARCGATLLPLDTSWPDAGISLGSYKAMAARPPRIAVLTRPPVAAQPVGWLAYLLEQVYHLAYTALEAEAVTARQLRDYDVLLLADSGGYGRVFGGEAEWLLAWVEAGGTLVSLGGQTSAWLVGLGEAVTTATLRTDVRPEAAAPPARDAAAPIVPAEHRPAAPAGAAVWVELDPFSYVTAGCPARLRVPLGNNRIFRPTLAGHNLAVYPTSGPVVAAGFVPERTAAALPGMAWAWQERLGAGQLVCFAEAPTFRASWPVLDRLWLNAALLGPSRTRE